MDCGDQVHFYAVVLDAQFPHKSFKSDKFMVTMRIADPDQPFDKEGVVETCSLVMFAKSFEDLPICQRIGDIIRVHRAYVGEYKGVKQFTCNIFFNASWALFSPLTAKDRLKLAGEETKTTTAAKSGAAPDAARDFHPFLYFGKSFSFEKSEHALITKCRDWINKSFPKNKVLSDRYITKLANVPDQGRKRETGKYYDFDLQGKVIQVFKLDDYSSEIRLIDDSS